MGWVVLGFLLGMFAGVLLWRRLAGKRQADYLALSEYWIYSDVQRLPPTAALMDAVVSKNPHNRPGRPCITAREGILFSDLRLHLAVAKRDKNLFAFRPDLFDEHAEPSAPVLEKLAESHSLVTVRFASNVPLLDRKHLQFTVHLSDTIARLTRAKLLFDTVSEKFWLPDELHRALQLDNDAERPGLHLRVVWKKEVDGCRATTLGLRKVGRSELTTTLQEPDEEVLVTNLVEQAAMRLFSDPELRLPLDLERDGDRFVVEENGRENGRTVLRLTRQSSQV